jgi:hypothetical protein
LLWVRTGDTTYRDNALDGLAHAETSDVTVTGGGDAASGIARNAGQLIRAAGLMGFHDGLFTSEAASFEAWMADALCECKAGGDFRMEHPSVWGHTRTYSAPSAIPDAGVVSYCEDRQNNVGGYGRDALCCWGSYLMRKGDPVGQDVLDLCWERFKGYCDGTSYGDTVSVLPTEPDDAECVTWMPGAPSVRRAIVAPGEELGTGHDMSGALAVEMFRGSPFISAAWPPPADDNTTYAWTGMAHLLIEAEVLYRAGYTSAFTHATNAIQRAYDFMWSLNGETGWVWGASQHATVRGIIWLANSLCDRAYTTANEVSTPSFNLCAMDWTHGSRANLARA